MSYEVFGTPPDPTPTACPLCGEYEHEGDTLCDLFLIRQRAISAEARVRSWISVAIAEKNNADDLARALTSCVAILSGSDLTDAIRTARAVLTKVNN